MPLALTATSIAAANREQEFAAASHPSNHNDRAVGVCQCPFRASTVCCESGTNSSRDNDVLFARAPPASVPKITLPAAAEEGGATCSTPGSSLTETPRSTRMPIRRSLPRSLTQRLRPSKASGAEDVVKANHNRNVMNQQQSLHDMLNVDPDQVPWYIIL